ncbi:MAG TPA: serine hydrolase domain-containing protein [Bryobacteraceae bacterium]|nr:serine hydrolase domain-containing protein [Bryobacteraceae bacterium]
MARDSAPVNGTSGRRQDRRRRRGPLYGESCERPVEALRHFAESSLLFEPGTRYRYSSYGWILASAAVEAVADKPFLTFMRERIFDPLGMRGTSADSVTKAPRIGLRSISRGSPQVGCSICMRGYLPYSVS